MTREEVLEELKALVKNKKYYVYCLSDPESLEPFYIGKGKDYRILRHSIHTSDSFTNKRLSNKLKSLRDKGKEVVFDILASSCDETAIYALETYFICKYGIKAEGGVLVNFSYGGNKNEYNAYHNLGQQEKTRQAQGDSYFGTPIYMKGFVYPSLARAVEVTGKRKSKTGLKKSILNGSIIDSCFLDGSQNPHKYDEEIQKIKDNYWIEQLSLVESYNKENPNKPIVVSDYRKGNPRYSYFKRLEEDEYGTRDFHKLVYVDHLPFSTYKYAAQYTGITPSYVRTLIKKQKPGYYLHKTNQ